MANGVISFNTSVDQDAPSSTPESILPSSSADDASCQFATAYNTVANGDRNHTSSPSKPIYADTACNQHMFGNEHLLEDVQDIEPVTIGVANEDRYSGVIATRMGTVKLKGFNCDGSATLIKIHNVLLAPALPANLVSVTSLYSSGFCTVDPHYGRKTSDRNLYYSNGIVTLPAHKDVSNLGFWKFHHAHAPSAYSASVTEKSDTDLWHLRFGHLNDRSTASILQTVMGVSPAPASNCKSCVLGKQV